jgi:hypothetical protein
VDDDQAVTTFVEICGRLDRLIVAQELTNSVLLRLAATFAQQQEPAPVEEISTATAYPASALPRGLGSLIPRH